MSRRSNLVSKCSHMCPPTTHTQTNWSMLSSVRRSRALVLFIFLVVTAVTDFRAKFRAYHVCHHFRSFDVYADDLDRSACRPSNEPSFVMERLPSYVCRVDSLRPVLMVSVPQDTEATQAVLAGVREGILRRHLEEINAI